MELGTKNIEWTIVLESFFKDLGEKSYAYSWLHKRCEAIYASKSVKTDLPVIVLSTISGTLSIGSSSIFPKEWEKEGSIAIGTLSLFVATLNTIGTYFSFSKRSEAHRLCAIEFGKLYRFLDIELTLPRKDRMLPNDLLKVARDNYERLVEMAPIIPRKVIRRFRRKFKNSDVSKPSEVNGLEEIQIFVPDNDDTIKKSPKLNRLASSRILPPSVVLPSTDNVDRIFENTKELYNVGSKNIEKFHSDIIEADKIKDSYDEVKKNIVSEAGKIKDSYDAVKQNIVAESEEPKYYLDKNKENLQNVVIESKKDLENIEDVVSSEAKKFVNNVLKV